MKIGIAADHGGFVLKQVLAVSIEEWGYEVTDYGTDRLDMSDDFPDFVVPLAKAVALGQVARGVAVCGSGVGACVAANKIAGVRAALITDIYSAHQGVEDDNMNLMCLGGRVTGTELSKDLVHAFLAASFRGLERYHRRLAKIQELEKPGTFFSL